jgi:putative sigma-54 modulation protein
VTVHSGPSILRGEERGADPQTAFDLAADRVSRQAQRHTKRLHGRHRTTEGKEYADRVANAPVSGNDVTPDDADEALLGKVVRVKRFEAKPMSQEEALAQMDLIGHDFFLYLDAETNDYALLYKRRDGDYGMLTPQRG